MPPKHLFSVILVCKLIDIAWTSTPVPIFGTVELPKAPHWDVERQCFFFVSVYESTIHKYVPSTKTHTSAKVGTEPMAFIIPLSGTKDKFIVSYGANLAIVTWDGHSPTIENRTLWKPIGDDDVYRANEGKVSPSGSLFVGGHSPMKADDSGVEPEKAALYILDRNGNSKKAISKVTVANGMAWSKDKSTFYFVDSLKYTVTSYSYNIADDSISNEKVLINFKDANLPGVPDGMAIDAEDKLWIAAFRGHQVIHFDPKTCTIIRKIPLDAFQITSVAFGGSNLDDFYVTTGKYKMNSTAVDTYPHSGFIFEQKEFEVVGLPGVPFKLA